MKRKTKDDYLSLDPNLSGFYSFAPTPESFDKLIASRRTVATDRETLVSSIERKYAGVDLLEKVVENIKSLRDENTYTVTTGHQLCLFGGPMFVIYKVLTTIKLADWLSSKYPDLTFVPVLWMATEDHDYEEINHCYFSFDNRIEYDGNFAGAVGRHVLEKSINEVCPNEWQEFFFAGDTYSRAWLRFANHLFGERGLVVVDADDTKLKGLFKETMESELRDGIVYSNIMQTNGKLSDAGYAPRVNPRDTNLFQLTDATRVRIDRNNSDLDSMLAELDKNAASFSPNVLMRPMYQEKILPNLVYIGGWAEMDYWMQLKDAFDAAGIHFPMLMPRFSATILTHKQRAELKELGLEQSDLQKPIADNYQKLASKYWDEGRFDAILAEESPDAEQLAEFLGEIDQSLPELIKPGKLKSESFIKKLRKKVIRVFRRNHPEVFERLESLRNSIQPEGLVQERVLNFKAFSGFTSEEFLELIFENIRLFNFDTQWISLPGKKN